ncbi:MAG: NAD(P)H-dependent oxidoreductase [Candidatus Zhuqueibacterota bacterium]
METLELNLLILCFLDFHKTPVFFLHFNSSTSLKKGPSIHVYILYAHPANSAFCRDVLDAFTNGLGLAGHTHEIGDLYRMNFNSEMDEYLYFRKVGLNPEAPVPEDVRIEQGKIDRADALAFSYPVWWSDCPANVLK